ITTKADHPRAMDAAALEKRASIFPCSSEAVACVQDALSRAILLAEDEKIVLVTGSIFVAASARIAWFEE
ncbi:MAG: hypothetical protein V3V66_05560, partial [Anaerolineales bacterium]